MRFCHASTNKRNQGRGAEGGEVRERSGDLCRLLAAVFGREERNLLAARAESG